MTEKTEYETEDKFGIWELLAIILITALLFFLFDNYFLEHYRAVIDFQANEKMGNQSHLTLLATLAFVNLCYLSYSIFFALNKKHKSCFSIIMNCLLIDVILSIVFFIYLSMIRISANQARLQEIPSSDFFLVITLAISSVVFLVFLAKEIRDFIFN